MRIDMSQLRTSFDTFHREVDIALDSVANQLAGERYHEAATTMNTLTERMARTSLNMRAILIKAGHIEEDA